MTKILLAQLAFTAFFSLSFPLDLLAGGKRECADAGFVDSDHDTKPKSTKQRLVGSELELPTGAIVPAFVPLLEPEEEVVVVPVSWDSMSAKSRILQKQLSAGSKSWLKKHLSRAETGCSVDYEKYTAIQSSKSAALAERRKAWLKNHFCHLPIADNYIAGEMEFDFGHFFKIPSFAALLEELDYTRDAMLGVVPEKAVLFNKDHRGEVFFNLKSLALGWCYDTMPPVIMQMPHLQKLTLVQCYDGDVLPKNFPPCLQELELNAFSFVGMKAEGEPTLDARASQMCLPGLKKLRLTRCTGILAFLDCLPPLLEELDLSTSTAQISAADVAHLREYNPLLQILLPPPPIALPPPAPRVVNPHIGRRLQFGPPQ
ncbi:hypothetical protein FJ365_02390 [Candidatus Dependentiae bacterium]|nr:hypothetical protein [Candidatus Dependentiae bacterium]